MCAAIGFGLPKTVLSDVFLLEADLLEVALTEIVLLEPGLLVADLLEAALLETDFFGTDFLATSVQLLDIPRHARLEPFAFIADPVRITLFGQEQLAMVREIFLFGFTGHERVKMRRLPRPFRTQQATQTLRLLLPRAERTGDLHQHLRLGQIERKIAHF